MTNHLILIGLLIGAGACTTEGVQSDPLGHAGSNGSGSDGSGSNGGNGSGGGALTANCDAAQGPEHPYTQASELDHLVLGQWIHCSGPSIFSNEQLGLEFDADGTYHLLASDGHGGIAVLSGFGNQGTWDASQEGASSVQWNIHPDPNSGTGGFPTFEDSPRKFAMLVNYSTDYSIYAIAP